MQRWFPYAIVHNRAHAFPEGFVLVSKRHVSSTLEADKIFTVLDGFFHDLTCRPIQHDWRYHVYFLRFWADIEVSNPLSIMLGATDEYSVNLKTKVGWDISDVLPSGKNDSCSSLNARLCNHSWQMRQLFGWYAIHRCWCVAIGFAHPLYPCYTPTAFGAVGAVWLRPSSLRKIGFVVWQSDCGTCNGEGVGKIQSDPVWIFQWAT